MKELETIFKEVLEELGFAEHKPDQMSNSDYWMCTCTAMGRYAKYQNKSLESELSKQKNLNLETLHWMHMAEQELQTLKDGIGDILSYKASLGNVPQWLINKLKQLIK